MHVMHDIQMIITTAAPNTDSYTAACILMLANNGLDYMVYCSLLSLESMPTMENVGANNGCTWLDSS